MKFALPILLFLIFSPGLAAQPAKGDMIYGNPTDFFLQGNIAYGKESFKAARLYYQDALMFGESAPIHYNLALTLIKMEEYPRARFHLLRAFLLDPANPDILANLQWLRRKLPGREFAQLPPLSVRLFQESTWWLIAAGCLVLAIALFVFPKYLNRPNRIFTFFIFILAGCAAYSLFAVYQFVEFGQWAVVSRSETVLRVAPTTESPGDAYLEAGDMVKLDFMTDQFYRVQSSSGQQGYLAMDEVMSLRSKTATMAR